MNLSFPPLEDIKSSYHEYLEYLKDRMEFVGKAAIETHRKLQHDQMYKQNEKVKDTAVFKEGLIIFLLAPTASEVHTGTRKFRVDYIGPLFIYEVLDDNKVILADLNGKILHGVFSTKRLKPGFVRLTHDKAASTIKEVREEISKAELDKVRLRTKTEVTESDKVTEPIKTLYSFVSGGDTHHNVDDSKAVFHEQGDTPENLTDVNQLPAKVATRLEKHSQQLPDMDTELEITKARFRSGHLQVLMTSTQDKSYNFWMEPRLQPGICKQITEHMSVNNHLRVVGSPDKLVKKLYFV